LGLTGLSAVAAAAVLLLPDFRRLPFSACRSGLHTQENTLQHRETKQSKGEDFTYMVADQHHFNADPDPAFHINADPDPIFTLMRIRILLFIKAMRICDHWSIALIDHFQGRT
jgi:hypothetical protein